MNKHTWNIIITDKHSNDVPINNIINTRASCYNNFINYIICNLALKNYNIVEGDKDIVFNTVITDTSITEVYKFINNSNSQKIQNFICRRWTRLQKISRNGKRK